MPLHFDRVHHCRKAGVADVCKWCNQIIHIGEWCDYYIAISDEKKKGWTFYLHQECTEQFKMKLLSGQSTLDQQLRLE